MTARARSLYRAPRIPGRKKIGENTITEVIVEEKVARAIFAVQRMMPFRLAPGFCLSRLSSTTTLLSTSIPIPRASPPRLIVFRVTPLTAIRTKVAAIEKGIDVMRIMETRGFFKNRSSTRKAIPAPVATPATRVVMVRETSSELSLSRRSSTSRPYRRLSSATWVRRRLAVATGFSPDLRRTINPTPSRSPRKKADRCFFPRKRMVARSSRANC